MLECVFLFQCVYSLQKCIYLCEIQGVWRAVTFRMLSHPFLFTRICFIVPHHSCELTGVEVRATIFDSYLVNHFKAIDSLRLLREQYLRLLYRLFSLLRDCIKVCKQSPVFFSDGCPFCSSLSSMRSPVSHRAQVPDHFGKLPRVATGCFCGARRRKIAAGTLS